MITEIDETTLDSIQNPAFRSYAGRYVEIYQDFIRQVQQIGLDFDSPDPSRKAGERTAALGKRGAVARNDGKSVYLNSISPGCLACKTAVGSHTFFISLKCHRNCFFCFNPNQEDYEYFRENKRDLVAELQALRLSGEHVQHLALTGGEPLLHPAETIQFFQQAQQDFPKAYTRLYTCGDHLDRPTLQALKDAGLDEIRFSIRVEDTETARRHTSSQIALARAYIQNVMVEMPVLPGALEEMKAVLVELDRLGVFGINLLEFCFPFNNVEEFRKRGYRIKARPFRVLYNYWYAGGLPVAGSEEACLELIDFAIESGLRLGVHYCSLENKHTGQLYRQNSGHKLPKRMYFSRKDYFLKSAKVFGDDIQAVKRALDKAGDHDYLLSEENNYLEFHVNRISALKKLDVEVGISYQVIEMRDDEPVLRELKVDAATPGAFRLSTDV